MVDFSKLTTSTLKEWHAICTEAYSRDRDPNSDTKEVKLLLGQYFGVDEYSDWNKLVENIEAELSARGEAFDPIELR